MGTEGAPAASGTPYGRYLLPRETRWAAAGGAVVVTVGTIAINLAQHRGALSRSVGPITLIVLTLLAWTLPMTVIAESGIKRWWHTTKSRVAWSQIQDFEATPAAKGKVPRVYANLRNKDDKIILIGVDPDVLPDLRQLLASTRTG